MSLTDPGFEWDRDFSLAAITDAVHRGEPEGYEVLVIDTDFGSDEARILLKGVRADGSNALAIARIRLVDVTPYRRDELGEMVPYVADRSAS